MRSLNLVLALSCLLLLVSSAAAQRPEPRRYAVLVGINEYREGQGLPKLAFAEQDVDDLEARLTGAGYSVTKLTQAAGSQRFTRTPVASNIRDAIKRIVGNPNLREEDTVVVALAGHGVTIRVQENSESPVEDKFFFCPADADLSPLIERAKKQEFPTLRDVEERHEMISIDELYESLAEFDYDTQTGCRAGLRLVMVDACRNDPSRNDQRAAESETRPVLPPPPGGLVTLFSCSSYERAYENPKLEHGVFFHYVIDGLGGRADVNRDGAVGVLELNEYVSTAVYDFVSKEYDGVQSPEFSGRLSNPPPLLEVNQRIEGSQAGELRVFEGLPNFRMAWIPAGRFTMGSPESEEGRDPDDDQVEVELTRGYWMGETEVTQAQWRSVMGSEPWKGGEYVREGNDYPATYVSWDDAVEFCRRLTEQERRAGRLGPDQSYRLPTEAEWEYACRAGSQSAYSFGNDKSRLEDFAWFYDNAFDIGEHYAHRVGQKKANPWNLRDMHGNVWEWCSDWFAFELEGGRDPQGPGSGSSRVVRSGSWNDLSSGARCSDRYYYAPGDRDDRSGFRVVAE